MAPTMEISPTETRKGMERGQEDVETLTVRNVGDDRYSFRVEPAEAYRAWVDPDPELFAINAQEERAVALKLRPPQNAKFGRHEFKVAVVNDDREDDRAELDVTLTVKWPPIYWIIIAIVVIGIIVLAVQLMSPSAR